MFHTDSGKNQIRGILSLAWPLLLMLFLNFLIGFEDVWAAGQIDHRVQAALGIITQSMFLFLIVASAVAGGAVASIGQSIGANRLLRAKRYMCLCLIIAALSGIGLLCVALPLRNLFVSVLRVPEEIAPLTRSMLVVYICTLPPYYMLIMQNAVFRARRQVMLPLYTMLVVTLVNTLGDFGFGLGWWGLPKFGVAGIVWATFISVTFGAALGFAVLMHDGTLRRANIAPLKWSRRALTYLLKVAVPSGLTEIVWNSGYLVLIAITASLPTNNVAALAGMAAGVRVESLLLLPAYALNLTASILVGHILGSGQPGDARRTGLRILGIGVVSIGILVVVIWPFLDDIAVFIAPNPAVHAETESYLVYNVLALPFTLTTLIMAGALAGSGATIYNLEGVAIGTWLVRLPLAFLLGHVILGTSTGIWISMLASQACQASIMFYKFYKMDWKRYAMSPTRSASH
jgi:multidrug resistance protein, MATE family